MDAMLEFPESGENSSRHFCRPQTALKVGTPFPGGIFEAIPERSVGREGRAGQVHVIYMGKQDRPQEGYACVLSFPEMQKQMLA